MKRILFLDLDDVLTDWKGYITDQVGGFVSLRKDVSELSESEHQIHDRMLQVGMEQALFWENLPVHEGARAFLGQMRALFDEVYILSYYYPYHAESKSMEEVYRQKLNWIMRHVDADFCAERLWVVSEKKEVWWERQKEKFNGVCFLIDDDERNIRRWQETGGVGIHHENFEKTLNTVRDGIKCF